MKEHFDYKTKARELHRLRIELEMERYGVSAIYVADLWNLSAAAIQVARAIANMFKLPIP